MSKLNFLTPLSNFQYSINIEYDLFDEQKIKSYLPTSNSLSIIEEILLSTQPNATDRARLLTGAYGKGKSHLVLSIISLLSGKDKNLFGNIISKAKEINSDLYNNILQYIESGKKFLPVVINAKSMDLKSNLLSSLSTALKENGLMTLMPSTFFDAAIDKLISWRDNFNATYKNFERVSGCSGQKFIDDLRLFDQTKYKMFVDIYPTITSGSEFNPLLGTDVVKIFESVAESIQAHGYSGIFIVYDEFGKFLEGSIEGSSAMDILLLQQFAEKSTRTGDKQIHLLLISHKGIDNYVNKLPKEKVDAWKAVADRFKKISIQSKDTEIFEMIAQVLKKDVAKFKNFEQVHRSKFCLLETLIRNDSKQQKNTGAFNDVIKQVGTEFVTACYPLHPYSLLMLPKVSELVAQNERTIFTFLSANEKYTVNYFIKNTDADFPIIEPDHIYDYFEPLFRGQPYGSEIRKQWKITNLAIAKLLPTGNDLAIKIVKTIALVYIIGQFEILPPSKDLINDIYRTSNTEIDIIRAFQCIKDNQLLIELQFKPHIRIAESSGNDIDELLKDEIATIESKFVGKEVLTENLASQYFYPVEYNDTLEITRYFSFKFIEYSELMSIKNIDVFIENVKADGLILAVLLSDEAEKQKAKDTAINLGGDRVIFLLPKKPVQIDKYLRQYFAVNNLIEKKKEDLVLVDELVYVRDDLCDLIDNYIETQYLKPELNNTEYINNGQEVFIRRKTGFSRLMSNICAILYNETPRIINENINKDVLSAPMKSARNKIIDGLLENVMQPNLKLVGSQEINVLRSVFVVPGIIKDLENPAIDYAVADNNFRGLFNVIRNFFLDSAAESQSFDKLYELLTRPEHHIGLKIGVIPFYIAAIVRLYKHHIVFKNRGGREIPINTDLLIAINEKPYDFSIKLENWNDEKEQYIVRLEACFARQVNQSEKEYSSFDYIVKAMQRWFLQLSRIDREAKVYCDNDGNMQSFTKAELKFKNALAVSDINACDFLFIKLPEMFNNGDYIEITTNISNLKEKVDINITNYINKTKRFMEILFKSLSPNKSLASLLKDYYDGLNINTKEHVFVGKESAFLDIISSPINDETRLIRMLLQGMFYLRIEDFNDVLAAQINDSIAETKEVIDKYNEQTQETSTINGYRVEFVNDDGNNIVKHFDKKGTSPQAKLLYNDITTSLEEYGGAMSITEKGQVLLEILKELCK